jgi:chromosome segregation ATPase
MFPKIEKQGDEMATSDFSEILELQQFKRLYEEQEAKTKELMAEKEMEISALHGVIRERDLQAEELGRRLQELGADREKLRGDYARLRQEAQEKIDKLMERIKELNQRIMGGGGTGGGGGGGEPERKTGIFR